MMQPSAAQLIDAARLALEERVAPDVKSELAASAVRSVTMILKHLAKRSDIEAEILWVENGALKDLLRHATGQLDGLSRASVAGLTRRISEFLAGSEVDAAAYPFVAVLDRENTVLRQLLDELLVVCLSAVSDDPQDQLMQELHNRIREHLLAQNRRERDLYFPVFTGPPV